MGEPLAAIGIFDEASELAATVGAQMESWSVRAGKILLMARLGYYDDVVADAPAIIEWAESGTDLFTGTIAMQALAIVGRDRDGCEVDVDLLAQRLRKAYPPGLLDCALLAAELGYPDKARGLLLECLDDLEASHAFDVSSLAVAYGEPELAAGILNAERRDDWDAASQLAAAAVLAEYREERVESRALFEAAAQKYGDLHLRPDKARVLEHLGGKRSQEASALWLEMGATRRIASD
jgi:hypothetical protein